MGNDVHLLARTAVLAGEIMLVSGAEIARIEDTIQYILNCRPDSKAQAMVFSTGIFVSLEGVGGEPITLVRRVEARSTNLGKIYLVNEVSRKLCSGVINTQEASCELEDIKAASQYKRWLKALSYVWIAFFFGVVLGGSPADCAAAALTGGVLGFVVYMAPRIRLNDFCTNALGAFSLGVTALALSRWLFVNSSADIIIISAIMPLVPGMIFTTAVRDTLNGDYSSGAARMLEAIVTALAVAAGAGAGMALFGQAAGSGAASQTPEAVRVAGAFMAVLSFGLVLELPKKYLVWSGCIGGICWLVYLLIKDGSGSLILAVFLSSLSVALIGHLSARILRAPVTVFLVPGILPLVPGTSIYNCVFHIIRSSREQSNYYLVETMQIAGAIAMAVFLMDSLFKMIRRSGNNKLETIKKNSA